METAAEVTDDTFRVHIEPTSSRLDQLDDRWVREVDHLVSKLREELGSAVTRHVHAVRGRKGGAEQIVLTLGSAGIFTAAAEVIRAWLARDRSRSVSLSWHADGTLQRAEITGSRLDDETIDKLLAVLAEQLDQAD